MTHLDIVVTGFEPFATYANNVSWDVAQAVSELLVDDGFAAQGVRLPVEFDSVPTNIKMIIDTYHPQLLVHLGITAETSCPQVEIRAVDKQRGKDNSGFEFSRTITGRGDLISPSVNHILATEMSAEEYDLLVSEDAGEYVCNTTLYYNILAFCNKEIAAGGFIHIPIFRNERVVRTVTEWTRRLFYSTVTSQK